MDKDSLPPSESNRVRHLLSNLHSICSIKRLWLATYKDKMESATCFSKKRLTCIFIVITLISPALVHFSQYHQGSCYNTELIDTPLLTDF